MTGKRLRVDRWTLVQHSAFGYQKKPGWDKGVEMCQIMFERELLDVTNEGGMIFESYEDADDAEMKENYPEGTGKSIMYPCVNGTFSDKMIDGLRIYIPAKVEAP
jgi:hypothetical protein